MRILFFLPIIHALKLCIDCKHFKPNHKQTVGKCTLFKQITDYRLVNGKVEIDYPYCYTARLFDRMCGQEGKYYEKNNTTI